MGLKDEIQTFLIRWNNTYPIDFWWRKKYHIPFGSPEHRSANFINMYIDFMEEKMMMKLINPDKEADKEFEDLNPGAISKIVKMKENEIDFEFDNLDLDKMNEHITKKD